MNSQRKEELLQNGKWEEKQHYKWLQTSKCRERGCLLWRDLEVSLENFANVTTIGELKNEMALNEPKVCIEATNDAPTEYISVALWIFQS